MRVPSASLGIFTCNILLFGVVIFTLPGIAYAADLSLTPGTGSVSVGSKISVQVTINPGSDSVNAADGTINFDSSLLSVDSVSKEGSIFSLWTADPTFSNSAGTIEFSGGTPSAFSKSGKVLTIVFKGKAAGSASVTFAKGSILSADGKGTDVYKNGNGGAYVITTAAAATPPPADTSADTSASDSGGGSDGATPISPIITSTTYPKPDTWYGTSTAVFNWTQTSDVTADRTLWSTKDNDSPKITIKGGATTTQTVTGISDGISYFYVQGKNDFGWGDIAKFKIQVDTVPPAAFDVALLEPGSDGGPSKLSFKTDDALSGMDHYQIIIGTTTPISVAVKDVTDGTYPVPPQPGGPQEVTIKAYDKAGNFAVATKTLTLPAVAKPKAAASTDSTTAPVSSGPSVFFIVLLVLLSLGMGGLIAYNMYTRKGVIREKEKLLAAVLDVRDKNDRIFSAMREEFEQMVNNFDEKPQLTPEERELLEGIKEVLDISEELVDTSIEDLKKMVRNQP